MPNQDALSPVSGGRKKKYPVTEVERAEVGGLDIFSFVHDVVIKKMLETSIASYSKNKAPILAGTIGPAASAGILCMRFLLAQPVPAAMNYLRITAIWHHLAPANPTALLIS